MFALVSRKFATANSKIIATRTLQTASVNIEKQYDPTQVSLMDEKCILVDSDDNEIGMETKKNVHLIKNIDKGMLHRAFSVFLFDNKNRHLLLQQRSLCKITYPNHWTNTCCSHPLFLDKERDRAVGVQNAAIRRLNYELGVPTSSLDVKDIHFITRIQYRADNAPHDGIFAEHEMDYVLFVLGDFELRPNANEVKALKYVSAYELKEMIKQSERSDSGVQLTPWFKIIADTYLFKWWQSLDKLDAIKDQNSIHRF